MHRERTGRMETKKYLWKSYCHRIECLAVNFLAVFMWRKPLNSATLATTTPRTPDRVFDGTGTQVVAQMTNKCRIKIVQKELYNVRDPSWIRDRRTREENSVAI